MLADKELYLREAAEELMKIWPDNRSYTVVCHGHSIPCGYTAQNITRPFDAYPHLFHEKLAQRFPHSVINVIVSAIGGENSVGGAARMERDVLNHKPDLITIDYGRNDMFLTEQAMYEAWETMIAAAKAAGCRVILITPSTDCGKIYYNVEDRRLSDRRMTELITELAEKHETGLVDAHSLFEKKIAEGHLRSEYAVSVNHLSRAGHELVAQELMDWIPYVG